MFDTACAFFGPPTTTRTKEAALVAAASSPATRPGRISPPTARCAAPPKTCDKVLCKFWRFASCCGCCGCTTATAAAAAGFVAAPISLPSLTGDVAAVLLFPMSAIFIIAVDFIVVTDAARARERVSKD